MKLKPNQLFSLLTILALSISVANAQVLLTGKLFDEQTAYPLKGASLYIHELKLGTTTDSTGFFKFHHLPKGTYTIEIQLTGYKTLATTIKMDQNQNIILELKSSNILINEVIVTSMGNETTRDRSPTPITIVSHNAFVDQASTNVIDAIAKEPGVNAITTGPGVSKPEIRGLGFNRVLVTFDGIRQQDFQWGDEHGVQIDPYAVYSAEIVRGPASLQYGSDAVAGVINFKSAPFPACDEIQASYTTEYQTNNGLIGNSLHAAGNEHGFVWDIRVSNSDAHSYQNPKDGYVWGTAFNESNAKITLGINKNWGFSRLTISALQRTLEIPDGNRDSLTNKFKFDYPIQGKLFPTLSNFLSYNPTVPGYQKVDHTYLSWQNGINFNNGHLLADIGISADNRSEIDSATTPVLQMHLLSVPYSLTYHYHANSNNLKLSTGLNGMYEQMQNGNELQAPFVSVFLVPNYHLFDVGGFAIVERDFEKLTLNGGIRYDARHEIGDAMWVSNPTPRQQFNAFGLNFGGLSYSVGASYQMAYNSYVKINLAKSYRAPAITELGENGLHPGSSNYELGNINLKPESGTELDLSIGKQGASYRFEVTGFLNNFSNFIFASRLASAHGGDSLTTGFPTFKFQEEKAIITGLEAAITYRPEKLKQLEWTGGFSYCYSLLPGQSDSTKHLPWTPAPRLTNALKWSLKNKENSRWTKTFIKFEVDYYWAQKNIYNANFTEFASTDYTLMNCGLGTTWQNKKTHKPICQMMLNITNLGNIAYADHTSRLRYFLSYTGGAPITAFQQNLGIYDMGRNIGFKLIFPIDYSREK